MDINSWIAYNFEELSDAEYRKSMDFEVKRLDPKKKQWLDA
jgi:hypothetical protein